MNSHTRWLIHTVALTVSVTVGVSVANKWLFVDPVFGPPPLPLAEGTETLIVGASHSSRSFNPKDFRNAQSIAAVGELVFFTKEKVRAVIDQNPDVRTVVMSISPISISSKQDSMQNYALVDYYGVLGSAAREAVSGWNRPYVLSMLKYEVGMPLSFADDARLYVHFVRSSLSPDDFPFWGGYRPQGGNHIEVDDVNRDLSFSFYNVDVSKGSKTIRPVSTAAIANIKGIAQFLSQRGIRLILVRTPKYLPFKRGTPAVFLDAFKTMVEAILRDYAGVEYYDCSEDVLDPSLFMDPDHLNTAGSAYFSPRFAARIALATTAALPMRSALR